MNLFTPAQKEKLLENGSDENRDQDHPPVVMLVMPGNSCIWLLSELEPETPNIAFGLCDLGMGFPELGYVDLNEIQEIRHPLFDWTVEAVQEFEGKYPLTIYADAARMVSKITTDETLLAQCAAKRKRSPKP